MAITNEQVERINELARKKKAEGLSEAELDEKTGEDVTPDKLKEIQRKNGMRDWAFSCKYFIKC